MNKSARRRRKPARLSAKASDRSHLKLGWLLLGMAVLAAIAGLWLGGVFSTDSVSAGNVSAGNAPPQANRPTSKAVGQTPSRLEPVEPPSALPVEPPPSAVAEPPIPIAGPPVVTPAPTALATVEIYDPPTTVDALAKEEIRVVAKLIEDFPNDPEPLSLMGNVCSKHGDNSQAVEYWQKCIDLTPNRAASYDAMGMVALLNDEHAKAAALWRKMLAIDPKIPGGHYRLARALVGMGQLNEAIEQLQKDIEISPTASSSFCILGQVYLQLQPESDYYRQQAKQNFETAVRLRPDLSDAHYGLATVCKHLKQFDEFKRHMEKFAQLKAEHAKVDRLRRDKYDDLDVLRPRTAETYTQAAGHYFAHRRILPAEKLWRRAAALDPKNIACRSALASSCGVGGRLQEATQLWEQLCDLQPDSAACYLRLGALHARAKRFDEAQRAFARAVQLAPQQPVAHRSLAQVYLQARRNYPEALSLAKTAVRLSPDAPGYYVLAVACENNKDHAGALAAMQKALTLDPDNAKYKQTYARLQQKR